MIHTKMRVFLELRLPASQPLLKVVVGCFVLLYRNKVRLVLGCFYFFLSFVLMLFDVKSTNHLIFPPPPQKSGFATPFKITMNLSKVLSK
jgi:hypothetical protein